MHFEAAIENAHIEANRALQIKVQQTNAMGNVHNEVRHNLMVSDSLQLCGTLTRDLVIPMMVLNIGGIEDMRRSLASPSICVNRRTLA
ncbi:DUF935 family protein [Nitrosomonas sp. Is37]|uniref:phage portal protein family protein n=1 Tax=Nitrosomonas sp. Is37 TaxID=3080535 RepID=UPI00294AF1C3|nr:DUF935 family protein [Nitrosomonas sp. Is37]